MDEPSTADTVARLLRGLRLATLLITLVTLFGLDLPLLVANFAAYRSPGLEVAAFVLLSAVAGCAGVFQWRDRPLGRLRWLLLVAVFAASAAALTGVPPALLVEEAEWSYGTIGWFGLLLFADRGVRPVLAFLAAHLAISFGQLVLVGPTDRTSLVGMAMVSVIVLGYQLAVALATVHLHRLARTAREAARREERMRTREAVAGQLHRDRRARFADLATSTVPLLTGLASGLLDPAEDRVRQSFAVEAARMRRLFAERDDVPDRLLHEVRACVDLAERKGVTVALGTWGECPELPLRVRRALTEPVMTSLVTAVAEARVTVVGAGDGVTVSVVTDAPPPERIASTVDDVAVTRLAADGRYWVEATWRAKN
ncbi:hypothetical protein [Amycolatopsis anabasis]|uniref:hypothetical protein n=1 Tax=Amycolatopsis anabasis TaxID=1840409 RepID=UPI00131C8A72|nr:hypothetical protein [Amycolatopsis anabasis]